MAYLELNVYSKSLMRTVPVNVILPADSRNMDDTFTTEPPYRTIYLLHGWLGNYTDWLCNTRVIRYAMDHQVAVVMPSADNRFYLNHPGGGNDYSTFIQDELPELCHRMFPLSDKREDRAIAGLSMGGFGSLVNGLASPQKFGWIGSFSAPMILEENQELLDHPEIFENLDPAQKQMLEYNQYCLATPIRNWRGSVWDYHQLAKELIEDEDAPKPKIYLCCGTEDHLYDGDVAFYHELKDLGYSVRFEKMKGDHEWDVWDQAIKEFIEWFAPDKAAGVSSGNIKK